MLKYVCKIGKKTPPDRRKEKLYIMKRTVSLLLVLLMSLSLLAACSSADGNKTGKPVIIEGGDKDPAATLIHTGGVGDLPDFFNGIEVTPLEASGRTVGDKPSFRVVTKSPGDIGPLAEYTYLVPETKLAFSKLSDTEFRVDTLETLPSGSNIKFCVGNKNRPEISFAFETGERFGVSSTIPANKAMDVPVNTGIEIVFSEKLAGKTDVSRFVGVSPSFEYTAKLYPDGKTLLILPSSELDKRCEYTVFIKKGLTSVFGDVSEEDVSFSFITSGSSSYEASKLDLFFDKADHFPRPGQVSLCSFDIHGYRSENDAGYDFEAGVYELEGADELTSKVLALLGEGKGYDVSDLRKVAEVPVEKEPDTKVRYDCLIPGLDKGAYILAIKATDRSDPERSDERRVLLQVSDISCHVEVTEKHVTLIAAKNGSEPVEGAKIEYLPLWKYYIPDSDVFTPAPVATDPHGGATFAFDSASASGILLRVTSGEESLLIPFMINSYMYYGFYKLYPGYSPRLSTPFFLYTDREEYFSSDTVNFTGFTAYEPKEGERLWYSFTGTEKMPLELRADGSFSGSYSFDDYTFGSVTLSVFTSDGKTLYSKLLSVTEEDKPKYRASLVFDKPCYVKGETASVTLTASYFDGTPAEGLRFVFETGTGYSRESVTDENGEATFSFRASAAYTESNYPGNLFVTSRLTGNEMTDLTARASAVFFHFDTWLKREKTEEDETGVYSVIRTNELDLSGIKSAEDVRSVDFPLSTVGNSVTKTLDVKLRKITYEKKQSGQRYDAINKVFLPLYNWETKDTVIMKEKMTAENGVLRLKHVEDAEDNEYYYYDVSLDGVKLKLFANGGRNRFVGPSNPSSSLTTDKQKYKTGEEVNVVFIPSPDTKPDNRALTVYYKGGYDRFYPDGNVCSFPFKREYASGICISLAFFDEGRPCGLLTSASFDPDDNKLELEVLTDKTEYRPGDKASVRVKATYADGKAASGALLTLSVVDEACFALKEQTFDALASYYVSAGRPERPVYNSYIQKVMFNAFSAGAATEKGGDVYEFEDSESPIIASNAKKDYVIRTRFENNPVFTDVVLDPDGEAELVFDVPDNVTSWRLTSIARIGKSVDKTDAYIGQSVTSVISTLPAFIDVESSKNYLSGDSVCVSFKLSGKALTKGEPYEVTAELSDGENTVSERTLTGEYTPGKRGFIDFGELPVGAYTLRVTSECGDFRDGIESRLNVIESGVGAFITVPLALDELKDIKPARFPMNLTFCSPGQREYLSVLYKSVSGDTARADAKAAFISASELLSEFTQNESELKDNSLELARALNNDHKKYGLISLLPYSAGDFRLTSLICALSLSALSPSTKENIKNNLKLCLRNDSFKNAEELCYSYLALSSLGSPVLDEVLEIAETKKDYSAEARLALAFALVKLGDYPSASALYNEIKASAYTENSDGTAYLRSGGESVDEDVSLTSLALVTASDIYPDDAQKYDRYIAARESDFDSYDLQRLYYLSCRRISPDGANFTLTRGGKTEEITLKGFERYSVDLNTLSGFEASSDDGVIVLASYYASGETLENAAGKCDEITLDKSVSSLGEGFYRIDIDYKITTDLSYFTFRISDSLPSGTKYYKDDSYHVEYGSGYTFCRGGQTVGGYISRWEMKSGNLLEARKSRTYTGKLSYVVRAAIDGKYTVEKAAVISSDGRVAFSNDCGKYEFSSKVNNGFVN